MSDVIAEVRDAMRREKLENFWQKNGLFVIGLLILLVVGTAFNAGYKAWQQDQNMAQTKDLLNSFLTKDPQKITQQADTLQPGLQVVALMNAAGVYMQDGKKDEAAQVYEKIISAADAPLEMRQLAQLSLLRINRKGLNPEGLVAELGKVWSDAKNPWRNHARLEAAVILANDLNNHAEARALLATLTSADDVPRTLKQKAMSLDLLYALQEKPQTQATQATKEETTKIPEEN